jgi:hypothetical protein
VNRRLIEIAFLLPILGLFLLTPPIILVVQAFGRVTGFPLFIVYLFTCWALLIAAGAALSIRLGRMEDAKDGAAAREARR